MLSRTTIVGAICLSFITLKAPAAPVHTGTGPHVLLFSAPDLPGAIEAAPSFSLSSFSLGILLGVAVVFPLALVMRRRQLRKLRDQRALLGDELHDQLGPMIYYSRMLLANEMRQQSPASESMLELQQQLAQTGETVRDLSRTLRHKESTTLEALEATLAMQLERWHQLGAGAYVVHGIIPEVTLTLVQYTQILRVLQELMLNSCRHATEKAIHIAFEYARRRLRIRYWDEGPGFANANSAGTGSASTLARMQRIGGSLELENRYPEGYEITLTLTL